MTGFAALGNSHGRVQGGFLIRLLGSQSQPLACLRKCLCPQGKISKILPDAVGCLRGFWITVCGEIMRHLIPPPGQAFCAGFHLIKFGLFGKFYDLPQEKLAGFEPLHPLLDNTACPLMGKGKRASSADQYRCGQPGFYSHGSDCHFLVLAYLSLIRLCRS